MAAPNFEHVYVSVACNRTPNALDWGNNQIVCYGASHAVALYQPEFGGDRGKIVCTLHQHSARVNCVRWIRGSLPGKETEFVSGAADGSVIFWRTTNDVDLSQWTNVSISKGSDSINAVDGIYWENDGKQKTIIVAAGGNYVQIWMKESDNEFQLIHENNNRKIFVLDAKLHWLPQCHKPILALACDDGNVQLLGFQVQNGQVSLFNAITLSGHEDWVRSLAFTIQDDNNLLLATAAQDSLIRVWQISSEDHQNKESALQTKKGSFSLQIGSEVSYFRCQLETVLHGHENWVYGLSWQPRFRNGQQWTNPLQLLSCSMDKTMIIWGPDPSSGLWIDRVRVGEVGGNTLGFYGCHFGNSGSSILAHGYQGALHLWHVNQGVWKPGVVCGGHFDCVEDLAWEPSGKFILSVSSDQTTRLHAPWYRNGDGRATWHEIARPQVHGYDLSSVAVLGPFRFASGAEEKVIRVFEAPNNFRLNLARICGLEPSFLEMDGPEGAAVPALGLSNKPVYPNQMESTDVTNGQSVQSGIPKNSHVSGADQYSENYFTPTLFDAPPTEETLLQNTLWPEVRKLYGHGYEVFAMASDPQHMLLVSSSRAQKADQAAILVWNASTGVLVDRLEAHTLTVTQMSFSPDGQRLVSVSRDRSWAVHVKCQDQDKLSLRTVARGSGGSRILWSCHWSPDSRYFVTGSRDKRLIVWSPDDDAATSYSICGQPYVAHESVTAVAFSPLISGHGSSYVIAIGTDDGCIGLFLWTPSSDQSWNQLTVLDQSQAHHMTVKRLQFRPLDTQSQADSEGRRQMQLASCGADHALKIYNVYI